jgi:hypothetical protein
VIDVAAHLAQIRIADVGRLAFVADQSYSAANALSAVRVLRTDIVRTNCFRHRRRGIAVAE